MNREDKTTFRETPGKDGSFRAQPLSDGVIARLIGKYADKQTYNLRKLLRQHPYQRIVVCTFNKF